MRTSVKFVGVVLSLVLLLSLILVGCVGVEEPEAPKYTVAILPFHVGCLWFDPFTAGGKWYLESKGCKVIVGNAEWDTKKMNSIMRTWAEDPDIDAVIVAPLGGEEVLPGIRALKSAGKVVILTNNEAGYAPEATLSVEYDSAEACGGAAEKVVEMLIEKSGEPKGTVILGLGDVRTPEHVKRADGFRNVFQKYSGIEVHEIVTNMDAGVAITRGGDLLRTLPQVDAVISVGMLEFMGFVNALEREGMAVPKGEEGHIICVGVDTAPEVLNPAIKEGIIDFAVDQPVLAYNAIAGCYLLKYLEEGETALPEPGTTISASDINIKTQVPLEGWDLAVPSDAWAPAEAMDTEEEFGHVWIKTNYVTVDSSNVDDPMLWSNITLGIKAGEWGF